MGTALPQVPILLTIRMVANGELLVRSDIRHITDPVEKDVTRG